MKWFKKYFHSHCDHHSSWQEWEVGRQHGTHKPVQDQYRNEVVICCQCGSKRHKWEGIHTEIRTVERREEDYIIYL